MNYLIDNWEWIAATAVVLFFTPFFILFSLIMYAARTDIPFAILRAAEIPDHHKQAATAYLHEVRKTVGSFGYVFREAIAPYAVFVALLFTKWEAEKLPKLFAQWDNEVNLNGDKREWVIDPLTGQGVPLPCPLEDTPEARDLCYWAKGHHPRSFYARWVWLGWRNRASMHAYLAGPYATPELKADTEYWGDIAISKSHAGTLIRRMGPYYEVYRTKKKGFLCLRTRYGCKIGNVLQHGAGNAMLIGNGVALLRWKSK